MKVDERIMTLMKNAEEDKRQQVSFHYQSNLENLFFNLVTSLAAPVGYIFVVKHL